MYGGCVVDTPFNGIRRMSVGIANWKWDTRKRNFIAIDNDLYFIFKGNGVVRRIVEAMPNLASQAPVH